MRSAYAPDLTPDRAMHWSFYGPCKHDPDLWSSANWGIRAAAAHICRTHCPVLKNCTRELEDTPTGLLHTIVMAGIDHTTAGKATWINTDYVRCAKCDRRGASQKAEVAHKGSSDFGTLSVPRAGEVGGGR